MMTCAPCERDWLHWGGFANHMHVAHGIDRELLMKRGQEVGFGACVAVLTDRGRWMLMIQPPLPL